MGVWMLDITLERDESVACARVGGRLDGDTATEFEENIVKGAHGASVMVVNMSGVVYLSSAGLRSLIVVANSCHKTGTRIGFSDLTAVVQKVFEVSGFYNLLAVYPTESSAREALVASAARG